MHLLFLYCVYIDDILFGPHEGNHAKLVLPMLIASNKYKLLPNV